MTDAQTVAPNGGGALSLEQSCALADQILRDAGWTPHPEWGCYTRGTLVMGGTPDGQTFFVKDWARIPPGHPQHGPDTPDEPHEAAAWLVARFAVAPTAEAGETAAHESDGETGAETDAAAQAGDGDDAAVDGRSVDQSEGLDEAVVGPLSGVGTELEGPLTGDILAPEPSGDDGRGESEVLAGLLGEPAEAEIADSPEALDYAAHELLEPPELGEELADAHPDEYQPPQDRFYGLDDLDRRKTVAIGLVMRHAKAMLPFWTTDSDAALRELRNFSMGVSEGRWPDDPSRREELDALEETLRYIRRIEAARDAKVEFLEQATRDEIEGFDPEAGWPD